MADNCYKVATSKSGIKIWSSAFVTAAAVILGLSYASTHRRLLVFLHCTLQTRQQSAATTRKQSAIFISRLSHAVTCYTQTHRCIILKQVWAAAVSSNGKGVQYTCARHHAAAATNWWKGWEKEKFCTELVPLFIIGWKLKFFNEESTSNCVELCALPHETATWKLLLSRLILAYFLKCDACTSPRQWW